MSNHVIFVKRIWQTTKSTISTYEISGTEIRGYILERPGPDTTTPNQNKRVPEGSYRMKWHVTHNAGVRKHNPVPLLYSAEVSQSRGILIHNGNLPSHSEGCLLIGKTKGIDFIGGSVPKLDELKKFLEKEGIQNVIVHISSCYTTK